MSRGKAILGPRTVEGYHLWLAPQYKTVNVSFQLRVPKNMRAAEVKNYINSALVQRGISKDMRIYKQRVEVFMP